MWLVFEGVPSPGPGTNGPFTFELINCGDWYAYLVDFALHLMQ
jgi:hypothetical protein